MPENKKADDFSVDDIIKDVMRKKRRIESENVSSNSDKSYGNVNIKKSNIKTEDVNDSKDYFKSFYNDSKTDNSANRKIGMNNKKTKSDIDALKTQENYMKKNLNKTSDDSDISNNMAELFANAVKKSGKKLSPAQQAAIKEARNTNTKSENASSNLPKLKKNEYQTPAKPEEWRTDGIPLSDLVAGAMQTRKSSKTTINDVTEPVSNAQVYNAEPEARIKPKRRKWSLKKKASVILCYVFGVVFLLCGAGISVFATFTGMLDRNDNIISIIDPGQSEIGSNDTVDAVDYEKMLADKLAKSAANVVSDSDVTNILLVGEDLRATIQINQTETPML